MATDTLVKLYAPTVYVPVFTVDAKGEPGDGRNRQRKSEPKGKRKPKGTRVGKPLAQPLQLESAAAAHTSRIHNRIEREIRSLIRSEVGQVTESLTEDQAKALLTKLRARLDGFVNSKEEQEASERLLRQVAAWNRRQFRRAVGVDVPEFSAALGRRWIRENVANIRGIAEEAKQRIESLVLRSVTRGLRAEAFADELQRTLGLSHREAKKVAVGQVIRLHSRLTEHRQTKAGIERYKWRTAGDGHVRHWHRKLNGTIQRWDSPPVGGGGGPKDRGHPGSADRCRCQPIPIVPIFEDDE